jgi:hypothetical protein
MTDSSTNDVNDRLFSTVLAQLAPYRASVQQDRVFDRLAMLTLGSALSLGRHTTSQLLVTLGATDDDWSAWYRLFNEPRVETEQVQSILLGQVLEVVSPDAWLPVALDATQLPRSSRHFPGSGYAVAPRTPPWIPGIHRAQKWALLSPLLPQTAVGDSRAVPVRCELIRSARTEPMGDVPVRSEARVGADQLAWMRTHLATHGRANQRVLAIADGVYSTAPLLSRLPHHTTLLARCARNRARYRVPPHRTDRRGRPRRYGERGPTPEAMQHDKRWAWQDVLIQVRGRTIRPKVKVTGPWLVKGAWETPFFCIVIQGVDRRAIRPRHHRNAQFWCLTAAPTPDGGWTLPMPLAEALSWAWQRWEVEVMHRELKSGFGLGEQQAFSATGAATVTAWAVWAYALIVLAGYRTWGLGPAPLSRLNRWWTPRRWSFAQLWQGLRQELWQAGDFQPVWTRSPDTWHEMTTWYHAQTNAVLGYRRL